MASRTPALLRQMGAGLRVFLGLTIAVGVLYPLLMTGVGQLLFRDQANGSLVEVNGQTVGSSLIGQNFADGDGKPLPQWFQPRPSAGSYDPGTSGASNLGPENSDLVTQVNERRAQVAAFDGVRPEDVAPDALTASGSGLDPHISPRYAYQQVNRVATARGLNVDEVTNLVDKHVQGRVAGIFGSERVNVLELNLALEQLGR